MGQLWLGVPRKLSHNVTVHDVRPGTGPRVLAAYAFGRHMSDSIKRQYDLMTRDVQLRAISGQRANGQELMFLLAEVSGA